MNIDKQIEKLIDKHIFVNDDGTPTSSSKLVSQIKQSILKAIMDRLPRKLTKEQKDRLDINDKYFASGWNSYAEEFESVIKEVLK